VLPYAGEGVEYQLLSYLQHSFQSIPKVRPIGSLRFLLMLIDGTDCWASMCPKSTYLLMNFQGQFSQIHSGSFPDESLQPWKLKALSIAR
jgi:hypothetical protein